ncbi:sulfatase-like hydrolase/transferase [Bradyrhizobium sp.]|uniref:sulfatase-like hydrolase/transferase n=1 Tax=Bradyrhizobium sp. TaxID=376 RepID=UPI002B92094E|nr:sulfatase-like hydrolase/transferase [Bradyrhizobium sp.]HMM89153.1 sulfatase-like hydrolase/transferase [Bradyrhizobium sp.]
MTMFRTAPSVTLGGGFTKIWGTRLAALAPAIVLHAAGLILLVTTERSVIGAAVFLLAWIMLNCLCLALIRRPTVAALISLELLLTLTLLSRFKFDKLWMTVDFVDVMIIDRDTTAFLLAIFPSLRWWIALAAAVTVVAIAIGWRLDRHRIGLRQSLAGFAASATALVAVSLLWPTGLTEDFEDRSYVSKFARTGAEAVHELMTRGYLDAAAGPAEHPAAAAVTACRPARKLPHIILLHDESSFDLSAVSAVKVPAGYSRHFESFDGKSRKLRVEGVGGPSWFTEFNVLTGLSVRSFGRFATSVTRIAAGHVYRGLPRRLSDCGYQTFSLYPFYGSFIGSRAFQITAGIAHYLDMHDLGTADFEPDIFYYDRAIDLIARERNSGPLFLYVYTVANHFPWDKRLRPELTPDWRALGNPPDVEEYIRRQSMSAQDYRQLLERLAKEFPTEAFLIIRYGDHQPQFAPRLLDPSLKMAAPAKRTEGADPRYLTTYYAIDAVNFTPVDVTPAIDGLDASYLPLVALQAAGVPLDASFSAQRAIMQRCGGYFHGCQEGTEARRFNRLLIDAGLIRGL